MSDVDYTGDTLNFSAEKVDDGGFLVTVRQRRKLDPYRDPHGMRDGEAFENKREVAQDTVELRYIFNQCFPEK